MCSCHRTQMGGTVDQFLHLYFGILVSLPALGVLQFIADSRFVDIGDVGTKQFILPSQFVHLIFKFCRRSSAYSRATRP